MSDEKFTCCLVTDEQSRMLEEDQSKKNYIPYNLMTFLASFEEQTNEFSEICNRMLMKQVGRLFLNSDIEFFFKQNRLVFREFHNQYFKEISFSIEDLAEIRAMLNFLFSRDIQIHKQFHEDCDKIRNCDAVKFND